MRLKINQRALLFVWSLLTAGFGYRALADVDAALPPVNFAQVDSASTDEASDAEPFVYSICTDADAEITRETKVYATINELPRSLARSNAVNFCTPSFKKGGKIIQIRRRGFSSDRYAKKQFLINYTDAAGGELKVSMLGLPQSEKWIFNSPYTDRSYMRNALGYRIGAKVNALGEPTWFAPKIRYIELYINNNFRGLYILTEKIQRGKRHINLPKIDLKHPEELSYILEISSLSGDFKTKHGSEIEHTYPSAKKLTEWEQQNPEAGKRIRDGIKKEINHFEDVLRSRTFTDPVRGYRAFIDVPSFVDYFIMREAFKDLDGFRRSAYFHKGRDKKLHMGPLWDFDISLGNMRLWNGTKIKGWVFGKIPLYTKEVFWFKRLLQDPYFTAQIIDRYRTLRQPGMPLHFAEIDREINILTKELGTAPERDMARWHGTYGPIEALIITTKHKCNNAAGNIEIMRQWFQKRLLWVDAHIEDLSQIRSHH